MKNEKCLQPRIDGRWCRQSGQVQWVFGLFMILLLAILCGARLKEMQFRTTSQYVEDALAASNLASAIIDVEEYGRSHIVRIDDTNHAFHRYRQALKENLNLDENWMCANPSFISGPVSIAKYVIYNVEGSQVTWISVNENNSRILGQDRLGQVYAPNGKRIEDTSIYSEICFTVNGVFENKIYATKDNLVDIVGEPMRENKELEIKNGIQNGMQNEVVSEVQKDKEVEQDKEIEKNKEVEQEKEVQKNKKDEKEE